jgi:hypothetical protein
MLFAIVAVGVFDAWLYLHLGGGFKRRPRVDWLNPDYAPPASSEAPHVYEAAEGLRCCKRCGGGSLHSVHDVPRELGPMAPVMNVDHMEPIEGPPIEGEGLGV